MLSRANLWSLEEYSERRSTFRTEVLAHKKNRQVMLGGHIALIFEDELTIRYQIQEMLRIEKVYESAGIQDELDAYNPLIPDGDNWKCTMLIQYNDVDERKRRLAQLIGVEDKVWIQVGEQDKSFAICDEDMDRTTEDKTSAVHFMRYPLTSAQVSAAQQGAVITIGVDHSGFPCEPEVLSDAVRRSLVADLASRPVS
ncbi:MAG: hypothetical protein ACI8VR_002027 [Candidatus Azotimanducaceae bacterium]|jgi:hypothetical protein